MLSQTKTTTANKGLASGGLTFKRESSCGLSRPNAKPQTVVGNPATALSAKIIMRQTIITIAFWTCLSCNETNKTNHLYADTVIKKYFALIDTSGKFDTTDINFKALKAYYNNDTSYLKELNSYIKEQYEVRRNWDLWQSDIPLPPVNKLNVEVAFRFIFSIYSSPTYEAITITQSDTVRKLHYLCYYYNRDSAIFHKRKEFEKTIKEKDWQEIASKLLYADFWGMKSEKDYRGNDGNDLTVIGYQKFDNNERYHFVHRWTNTPLNDAFYYVYYNLLNKDERLFATE